MRAVRGGCNPLLHRTAFQRFVFAFQPLRAMMAQRPASAPLIKQQGRCQRCAVAWAGAADFCGRPRCLTAKQQASA